MKRLVILIIMMAIVVPSLVVAQETQVVTTLDHHSDYSVITKCDIPINIKGIIDNDGKIILFNKQNRNTVSLEGKQMYVIASVDGIEKHGEGHVATVTDVSYKTNGELIVKMCIDCSSNSFEVLVKMDKDGSIYFQHWTGVTYFLKDAGKNIEQIPKPVCSTYAIKKHHIVTKKLLSSQWFYEPVIGSKVLLKGNVTGEILSVDITGIAIDDFGNIKIKIKPGNEFWTTLVGHKLIFNENLNYEIVDNDTLQFNKI